MISYIRGILENIEEEYIVIDVGGIGYQVWIPISIIHKLPAVGSTIKIHTYLHVREDAFLLYGFLNKEDLKMFMKLISVNGIGPKGALGILSVISPSEISLAVITDDVKTLCKAPGIGKKTAQRIILDLKDKMKTEDTINSSEISTTSVTKDGREEAIHALVALGYSRSDAAKVVYQVALDDSMDIESILKLALKKLATI